MTYFFQKAECETDLTTSSQETQSRTQPIHGPVSPTDDCKKRKLRGRRSEEEEPKSKSDVRGRGGETYLIRSTIQILKRETYETH